MKNITKLTFKHLIMTIGKLPSSYVDSLSYYECLVWLCKYLEETVIPTLNNNGEAVEELQEKYVELKNYVDTYFNNLDVQDEINNKLDEMAESGELEEIITSYLNTRALFTYNTVDLMKNATNLIDGSYAKTIGFYTSNDGVTNTYKIRNKEENETPDEMSVISLSNNELVAELIITNNINVKQLGAKGDGINDDTLFIERAFELQQELYTNYSEYIGRYESKLFPKIYNVYFPKGQYLYNGDGIIIQNYSHLICIGESKMSTSIHILKDVVLFNAVNHCDYLEIRNICFSGGNGVYNQYFDRTGDLTDPNVVANVTDKFVIENCSFYDYKGCCIGSDFLDSPFWYINNNYFIGTNTSIAIAMPGDSAGSIISNNSFELDKIHIKLQDGGRGVSIFNNDFIKFRNEETNLYDIWILPTYSIGTESSNYSQGNKCIISKNKFGGENVKVNDYKILLASQSNYGLNYLTDTTFSESDYNRGKIVSLIITNDNMFNGRPSLILDSIIYCCVSNLYNCNWDMFVNHTNYVVKFPDSMVSDYNSNLNTGYFNGFNTNLLTISTKNSNFNLLNISNIKEYFIIKDELKISKDYMLNNFAKDNFYDILYNRALAIPSTSNATSTTYTNKFGYNYGDEATISQNGYLSYNPSSRIPNKPIFIEFDLKNTDDLTNKLYVQCVSSTSGHSGIIYEKLINVTNDYNHYCIQLNIYTKNITNVRIVNKDYESSAVKIENMIVYASNSPQNIYNEVSGALIKLYRNGNNNALFRMETNNKISVTFADGTTKYLTFSDS